MSHTSKQTKIVATIGPKTESVEMLTKLVETGLNVMRLNMSHGDHEEHGARIVNGRKVAKNLGKPIAILQDLAGPKIRTGSYETDRIVIEEGNQVVLTTVDCVGNANRIFINYPKLAQEVGVGSTIMLDDGKKRLTVESIKGTDIHCRINVGGELKSRRGVNVPGAYLSIETITAKDRADLAFGVKNGVDMVALSFVRRASDVYELKDILKELGAAGTPVISKIETQEAVDNLEAIIDASDGAMVARGDLAIEIPAEDVPRWQKEIIRLCNQKGKPVITATQMLESMIHSPVPTRAEVSDVANAVYDGTDAVMLSEESTLGEYPIEAVETLARIAKASEEKRKEEGSENVTEVVSRAVAQTAELLNAVAIVALTESGTTARNVARFRPTCPIVALTPNEKTRNVLALSRGVDPYMITPIHSLEETLSVIPSFLLEKGYGLHGDTVIVTAGLDFGRSGATNTLIVITL